MFAEALPVFGFESGSGVSGTAVVLGGVEIGALVSALGEESRSGLAGGVGWSWGWREWFEGEHLGESGDGEGEEDEKEGMSAGLPFVDHCCDGGEEGRSC